MMRRIRIVQAACPFIRENQNMKRLDPGISSDTRRVSFVHEKQNMKFLDPGIHCFENELIVLASNSILLASQSLLRQENAIK